MTIRLSMPQFSHHPPLLQS